MRRISIDAIEFCARKRMDREEGTRGGEEGWKEGLIYIYLLHFIKGIKVFTHENMARIRPFTYCWLKKTFI